MRFIGRDQTRQRFEHVNRERLALVDVVRLAEKRQDPSEVGLAETHQGTPQRYDELRMDASPRRTDA